MTSATPARVLIAEDETLIRLDLRGLLESQGFEVCGEARDGIEAVDLARETDPDVAILDMKMPRLDGIEAARRITAERPVPIVMLTAYSDRGLVERAVAAGVFTYLVKPFREADIVPAVRAAAARHAELDRSAAHGRHVGTVDRDRRAVGVGRRVAVAGHLPPGRHRRRLRPRMRILVAEDEALIRLDLLQVIERAGYDVCGEARDGIEAVELARSERPDLAVLDVKMPQLDGLSAARRILDERPIPIVMLTAYGEQDLVRRAVEAGVFGYLLKPFREEDLVPAMQTARARFEELQAVREEVGSLADALAARKAIERAKGILMEKQGLTEQEAFARLRTASQRTARPMRVIAEAVIQTFQP